MERKFITTVAFWKLSESPYGCLNAIAVAVEFLKDYPNRKNGYYAYAELLKVNEYQIGKVITDEYNRHGGNYMKLIVETDTISNINQKTAVELAEVHAYEYAENHINHVNEVLNTNVNIYNCE